MGCGKSSVGRRLSELLCCPFMDLDSVIEEQAGRSIAEIFASDGEASFRQMELDALRSIILGNSCESVEKQSVPLAPSHSVAAGPSPYAGVRECQFHTSAPQPHSKALVLSLGGGVVMTPECAELVKENTLCIYLRTSVDTLVERLTDEAGSRPLLNTGNQPSNVIPSANTNVIPSEVEESTLRHRIETLMAKRTSTYEATAHHIIDTDGLTIEEIAKSLVHVLK